MVGFTEGLVLKFSPLGNPEYDVLSMFCFYSWLCFYEAWSLLRNLLEILAFLIFSKQIRTLDFEFQNAGLY